MKSIPILLFLILVSCNNKNKDTTNNSNFNQSKNDSLTKIIDSLKQTKLEIKPNEEELKSNRTFNEFAKEFISETPKSMKYYLENSESFILKNDYQEELKSDRVSSSSVYKEVVDFLKGGYYRIKKDKLEYKDDLILYDFLFRRDINGRWKFYQIEAGC